MGYGEDARFFWLTMGMARRVGVNLTDAVLDGRLDRRGFEDMLAHCRTCQSPDGCAAYLAAAGDRRGPAAQFCGNAADLMALR